MDCAESTSLECALRRDLAYLQGAVQIVQVHDHGATYCVELVHGEQSMVVELWDAGYVGIFAEDCGMGADELWDTLKLAECRHS